MHSEDLPSSASRIATPPAQATTLQCASCGAAVRANALVCDHCGAGLAALACPSCFRMMVAGSRFCPSCGNAAVPWRPTPQNMPCPGCGTLLVRGELAGSVLRQCEKCFGQWLDANTLLRLCRDAEQHRTGLFGSGRPAPQVGSQSVQRIRYVRCPECQILMNRVNFAEWSGIVVDVCREHGTWFEVHELQRVLQFIREGGMEMARERELADLARERRRTEYERANRGHLFEIQ